MEMQLEATCIGCRQAAVAQWVSLQTLLELCEQEIRYEGGGGKNIAVVKAVGNRVSA